MAKKLTNYEKGVLAIFGCDDAETTVICLEAIANMSNHDEDQEKLLKLIDRIEIENHFDYMEEYHLLSYEMECKKNLFVKDYQFYGGNREDNAPWRNYLNVKLVDGICTDRVDQSVYRLHLLASVTPSPEIQKTLFDLAETVGSYFPFGEDAVRYVRYLNANQMIVSKGKSRLKKGRDAYRMYAMWIPDLDKAYLPKQ